ncbi:MAG: SprT family zinc-dependent metalloprotease [Sulfurimonas sp.]
MLIDYDIVRSHRSSIGITVERDGSIIVNAPQDLEADEIEKHVYKKRLWLWEKLAIKKSYQDKTIKKRFVSGESFSYLGRSYRLEIIDEDVTLKLRNGWFILGKKYQNKANEHFKNWYSEHLRLKINERLFLITKKLNIEVPVFRIMELGFRWGSCTKDGILNFNWKIAMAPIGVVDYIIIHELVHLKIHTHNELFWKEVQRTIPNYLEKKKWLKDNGQELFL